MVKRTLSQNHLGCIIRSYRLQRGFTQAQLAETLNVSVQQIQKYECGKNEPNLERFRNLVQMLHIPPQEVLPPPRQSCQIKNEVCISLQIRGTRFERLFSE